jgi:hypothetical protein
MGLPSIPYLDKIIELFEILDEGFWPTVHMLNNFFKNQVGAKFVPIVIAAWILVFKITNWRYKKQREDYAKKRGLK